MYILIYIRIYIQISCHLAVFRLLPLILGFLKSFTHRTFNVAISNKS